MKKVVVIIVLRSTQQCETQWILEAVIYIANLQGLPLIYKQATWVKESQNHLKLREKNRLTQQSRQWVVTNWPHYKWRSSSHLN